jgi:hypothetical protein
VFKTKTAFIGGFLFLIDIKKPGITGFFMSVTNKKPPMKAVLVLKGKL